MTTITGLRFTRFKAIGKTCKRLQYGKGIQLTYVYWRGSHEYTAVNGL